MTVRVYRWDDASAPVLTGNEADYKLIDVLDKCLVAGYGSKTAAGWTKDYTGTGKATFKQGTGPAIQMYLRVDCSTSSQTPRLRGFETMSDVDTGTGPFPTDAQLSGGLYGYISSTTDTTQRPWVVVADAKSFVMWIGYSQTTAGGLATAALMPVLYFGDLDASISGDQYAKIIIAHSSASTSNNYIGALSTTISSSMIGHFMPRTYTQTGTAITVMKASGDARANYGGMVGAGTYLPSYPDPVTGHLMLEKLMVYENATSPYAYRGTLRGLWGPMHNLPASPGDTLSGGGTLTGKSFLLVDGCAAGSRCRMALETSDTW